MERRTSYSLFVRGFNLGEYHLRRKGSKDDHAKFCFIHESDETVNSRETMTRTFIPEASITISNLSLSNFNEVKHADTQAGVVQDPIGIFLVDFVRDRLVRWRAEVDWHDGDRVLESSVGVEVKRRERYFYDRKHKHGFSDDSFQNRMASCLISELAHR